MNGLVDENVNKLSKYKSCRTLNTSLTLLINAIIYFYFRSLIQDAESHIGVMESTNSTLQR